MLLTKNYLGMALDFSVPGVFEIALKEYVREIISEAQGDISGTAPTQAGNHLFSFDTTSASYLNESDAQHFHHIVAKLLFLCKISSPDIQTAVAFLATRVKGPDQDDYKNCLGSSSTSEGHQISLLNYAHIAQMK